MTRVSCHKGAFINDVTPIQPKNDPLHPLSHTNIAVCLHLITEHSVTQVITYSAPSPLKAIL